MFLLRNCLLVVLKNPLAWGSHHVSNACIFATWGVITSFALGSGKILSTNCLMLKTPLWALSFIQGSNYVRFLILSKFGSMHCILNGSVNWLFYMAGHLIFQLIHKKFPFDVVHIVVHVLVYDGILDFFKLWFPKISPLASWGLRRYPLPRWIDMDNWMDLRATF